MITVTKQKVLGAPTPMAGLALGIASLRLVLGKRRRSWWTRTAHRGRDSECFIGRVAVLSLLFTRVLLVARSQPSGSGQCSTDVCHGNHGGVQGVWGFITQCAGQALWLAAVVVAPYFLGTVHLPPSQGF